MFPDGRALIADSGNNRVLEVSADGTQFKRFAGTGELPGRYYVGGKHLDPNNPRGTQLWVPKGVAVLPDGRSLIADTWNHRVLVVSADGTRIELFAGTGEQPARFVGKGPHNDPNGPNHTNVPKQTNIEEPWGVAVFPDGRALITDLSEGRVFAVSADGNRISVLAGTGKSEGSADSRIDPNNPRNTQLAFLHGVAAFPDGRVLIADTGNDDVLVVSADGNRISVLVNTDLFTSPTGVAVLPDGRVLVVCGRVLAVSANGSRVHAFAQDNQTYYRRWSPSLRYGRWRDSLRSCL